MISCAKKRRKKNDYAARKKANKSTIWCMKCRKTPIWRTKKINKTCHVCCMRKCKKEVFLVPKMGHDLKHDEFRSYFAALSQEKRTSWNCDVWCVTTRNCCTWAGWTGVVVQSFLGVPKLRISWHHLGVLFGKTTFYWLRQSKAKPQH